MYDYVVIDFETTGLARDESREVLQVAMIDSEGNTLLNELCQPEHASSWAAAEKVNRISPLAVEGKPSFRVLVPRVREILSSSKGVVAFNDSFEKETLSLYGIDPKLFRWLPDPSETYRSFFNTKKWSLAYVAGDFFGYPFQAHDALNDVKATLYVYQRFDGAKNKLDVLTAGAFPLFQDSLLPVFPAGGLDGFQTLTEKGLLTLQKGIGLSPMTAKDPKPLQYKSHLSVAPGAVPCSVVGFLRVKGADRLILLIKTESAYIKISSNDLLDMQSSAAKPDYVPGNPLDGKRILFTGELTGSGMSRPEAGKKAAAFGAIVEKSVTQKLNFLVCGMQDPQKVTSADGKSTKQISAEHYNAEGKAHIRLLTEPEFLSLLESCASYSASEDECGGSSAGSSVSISETDFYAALMDRLAPFLEENRFPPSAFSRKQNKDTSTVWLQSSFIIRYKSAPTAKFSVPKSCEALAASLIGAAYPMKSESDFLTFSAPSLAALLQDENFVALVRGVIDKTFYSMNRIFDCCSRYEQCSDAKACVNPDLEYALGCGYRRRLRQGVVFFGRNRNVGDA